MRDRMSDPMEEVFVFEGPDRDAVADASEFDRSEDVRPTERSGSESTSGPVADDTRSFFTWSEPILCWSNDDRQTAYRESRFGHLLTVPNVCNRDSQVLER